MHYSAPPPPGYDDYGDDGMWLAWIGLAGVVLLWAMCQPQFELHPHKSTITDATTIRSAVQLYRLDNDDCPVVADLIRADVIDPTSRIVDSWENPFRIECEGNDIFVVSAGPDGAFGTLDDLDNTWGSGWMRDAATEPHDAARGR